MAAMRAEQVAEGPTWDAVENVAGERLRGWKAIADRLEVSVSMAQRLKRLCGLPTYTIGEGSMTLVFLDVADLETWWEQRKQASLKVRRSKR